MRSIITDKSELAERLLARFGYDEPIFTSEIFEAWREYERASVFKIIKELIASKLLAKADLGIYYFPSQTAWGKPSVLGRRQILDKRFIRNGDEVYGYYSGLTLLNGLSITTQMPYKIEIVSSKASAIVREVKIRNSVVTVRKSRVPISKDNADALMVLEAFSERKKPLEPDEACGLLEFTKLRKVTFEDVKRYADCFPKWTLRNIIDTGVQNVFA